MCTSVMPQSRMTSIWCERRGGLRIGRIGFGLRSENGYMRAPLPPGRMTPTMRPPRLSTRFSRDLAANQLTHHAHGIEGANLLAFFERASRKPDRDFREARAALRQPRGELGFEIESVGLDVHTFD